MSIKIGIAGYGNLGRGVQLALAQNPDMELVGIFTRRDPQTLTPVLPCNVYSIDDCEKWQDKIDVMLLCGGSATDLPQQGPAFAKLFHTVDSFDTHAKIPEYFAAVDQSAKESGHIGLISVGWDPGLFSLQRALFSSVLSSGETYTFWGKGVSQGHSDAIRRVEGVKRGIQYTIPIEEAVNRARSGNNPILSTREKHLRECFVVAQDGADTEKIKKTICEMPNYFADYDTVVHFISEEEFEKNHTSIPHGGFVIRGGKTGVDEATGHVMEFSLKLDSNPEFTASVLVAYARAVYRLSQQGESGAKTVLDIPFAMLSQLSPEELRAQLL